MNLLDNNFQQIVNIWNEVPDNDLEQTNYSTIATLGVERVLVDDLSSSVGVELSPDFNVEVLSHVLQKLSIIRLRFYNFADGRAYSQSRTLREQYGFKGDIRACGEVLIDQLDFMQRCGFNQFEISENEYETLLTRRKTVIPPGPLTTPAHQP